MKQSSCGLHESYLSLKKIYTQNSLYNTEFNPSLLKKNKVNRLEMYPEA